MSSAAATTAKRPFYGWVLVFLSGVLATSFYGLWIVFSVFLKPLSQEFGWARGDTVLAYSFVGVLAGVGGVLSGSLADRFGTRPVVALGGFCLGLGMFLTGFIQELWQLYLTYSLVLGGLGVGFTMVPVTSNIPRWFTKNKGLALGLAMAGTSLGIVVYPPLARFFINELGWRWAAMSLGLIAWGLVLPAAAFLRSHPRPEEIELGTERDAVGAVAAEANGRPARVLPVAQRKPVAYVRAAMLCCCICHSIPLIHLVAYATDIGIGGMQAASILSVLGIFAVVGRIGMGFMADRLGGLRTIIICSFLQSFMVLWLIFATDLWMFYAYAISFGVGYGGIMPVYPVILKELYGPEILGTLYGRITIGGTGGMAVGGYVAGLIFDLHGSYLPAFLFSFLVGTINFFLTIYLLWWTRREFRRLPQAVAPLPSVAAPAPA